MRKIIRIGSPKLDRKDSIMALKRYLNLGLYDAKLLFEKLISDFVPGDYSDEHEYVFCRIFNDVEFEDNESEIMDLGSSKYQMISAQEYNEAWEWYNQLGAQEKQYVDTLQQSMIPRG